MKWDPAKYVQFGDYRDRPFFDLTGRIHAEDPGRVVDLGCGPGNLTATLAERWPGPRWWAWTPRRKCWPWKAAMRTGGQPLLRAGGHRSAGLPAADTDVVVTNAALQWVPGHRDMLARWLAALEAGRLVRAAGARQLQFALPHADARNWPSPLPGRGGSPGCSATMTWWASRRIPGHHARRRLRRRRVGDDLLPAPPRRQSRPGVGPRHRTPARAGGAVRGGRGQEFEAEYSALLAEAYPAGPHGTVFPFRRTFAVAQKRG